MFIASASALPLTLDELWLHREFKVGTGGTSPGVNGNGESGMFDTLSDGVMDFRNLCGEFTTDSGGDGAGKCAGNGVEGGIGKCMPSPAARSTLAGMVGTGL